MQRELMLVAFLALLGICLLLGAIALIQSGDGRKLRARLRDLSGRAAEAGPALILPSIRVDRSLHSGLSFRLLRLIRFDPDMPQARPMALPLVALMAGAAGMLTLVLAGNRLGLPLSILAALATTILAARAIFSWQHSRYAEAVFQQIPDSLGLMVRAIRAGLPLTEALRSVAREVASPTREEFARVAGEMAIGRPVEDSLKALSQRTRLAEYGFLAVTLGLQSQTGGSLAETLDNLADIVRKRVAMAKRAKALAAEANMQAGMLVVLPFLAAGAMAFIQPFYITTFTENPTGQTMAVVGLIFMVFGLITIRWLIKQAGRD